MTQTLSETTFKIHPPGLLEGGEPLLHVASALRQEDVLGAVVEDDREGVRRLCRESLLLSVAGLQDEDPEGLRPQGGLGLGRVAVGGVAPVEKAVGPQPHPPLLELATAAPVGEPVSTDFLLSIPFWLAYFDINPGKGYF